MTSSSFCAASSACLRLCLSISPFGKEPQAVADAAHEERLHQPRLVAVADDEFGRAAADVDDQRRAAFQRRGVGDAGVDQSRFLATRDDLDREAERLVGTVEEAARVLRDAQRVGGHGPHRVRRERSQPIAEAFEDRDAAGLRVRVEHLLSRQARRQPHRFLQTVEWIDLAPRRRLDDAPDQQAKAVGPQVDGGEQFGNGHERWIR